MPNANTSKRYVYKFVSSPVGRLTLVATDDGLAAILWEHDRPGRVRLLLAAEEPTAPGAGRGRAAAWRVFRRPAPRVHRAAGRRRHAVPAQGVGGAADDPVRRDAHRTRRSPGRSAARTRCGRSAPQMAGTPCRSSHPAIASSARTVRSPALPAGWRRRPTCWTSRRHNRPVVYDSPCRSRRSCSSPSSPSRPSSPPPRRPRRGPRRWRPVRRRRRRASSGSRSAAGPAGR